MKKVLLISLLLVSFSFACGLESYMYISSGDKVETIQRPRKISSYQVLKEKYLGAQQINDLLSQDVLALKGRVRELKDKVKECKSIETKVEVEKEVLPWWLIPAFIVALLI